MGATGHDEVSHATWRRVTAGTLGAVALLAAGACSGSDDDATGDDDEVEGVELDTPTTQAPASDTEAVTGYVEDLLAGYEEAVNAILADQSVTLDDASPEVEAYRELFAPDSPADDEALDGWQANAEEGLTFVPTEDGRPAVASWLDGEIEVVSDDEVTFPTCDEHHMEMFDADGRSLGTIEATGRPGQGVAVRIDGQWYFRDLELLVDEPTGCRTEDEDREDA